MKSERVTWSKDETYAGGVRFDLYVGDKLVSSSCRSAALEVVVAWMNALLDADREESVATSGLAPVAP